MELPQEQRLASTGSITGGRILVVDDVPSNIHMLSNILRDDHEIIFATNGPDAVRMAKEKKPDLILLDIMLPEMDGYQICCILRELPDTRDIPIIFVSALGEEKDEARGLEMGAIDYFVKPLSPPIVRARVRNHIEFKRQRDLLRDMSQVDGLTGLPNKRRADDALASEWRRCQRSGSPISIFMVSLDQFKEYNLSHGHLKGDDCLRKVARTIAGYLCRPGDMAARYDGKVFIAILPDTELEGAIQLAEQARSAVEALSIPYPLPDNDEHSVTISCGVSTCVPSLDMMPFQLISRAKEQLEMAKNNGRNCVEGNELFG
ncbi:diguanylate cyclase domain-containing protein [Insolitispirillum peregrinum]|uniref:diguanylate cyclase n=1 Tax=Insolitispirillum peregrinum TaxID=80876 RepID=A0A1N7NSF5_9PROT|nr:diguanylate cyclase [Insolitispirillum peregrinum]SIT01240.1 diguanylate cyclase (GGDEF) domain-containing protein [Insolitispirillum peregrinum]